MSILVAVSPLTLARVNASIMAAISWLRSKQLSNGGFNILIDDCEMAAERLEGSTTFATSFIALAIMNVHCASDIIEHARANLESTAETGRLWRFLGPCDPRDPDRDDTALARVVCSSAPDSLAITRKLLDDDEIPIPTYFRSRGDSNSIDRVVNANIYFALERLQKFGKDDLRDWLLSELLKGDWKFGSAYYPFPSAYLHAVARAFAVRGMAKPEAATIYQESIAQLCQTQNADNCLEVSLSLTSAILSCDNDGVFGSDLSENLDVANSVDSLVKAQSASGSWSGRRFVKRRTKEIFYGGDELTTACVVEALDKWKNKVFNIGVAESMVGINM